VADASGVAYLVRHANAVSRRVWTAPDVARPLTETGLHQAAALASLLNARRDGAERLGAVLTSPALRCRQTVEPTAALSALELDERSTLMEGSDPLDALELVIDEVARAAAGSAVVACTHGDVLDGILETFAPSGIEIDGPLEAPKAVTWELIVAGGTLRTARYFAPPS
jgi:8-oxo-dGTP diphosphatase